MGDFDRAMEFILKHEGGYVNNPLDPGGETKYGISKRAYPALNIRDLTEGGAKEIYKIDYWEKAGCHRLSWPLSLIVMDTAVNMGVYRALRFLKETDNWKDYLMLRIEKYNRIASRGKMLMFLRGWLNRMIDLWRTANDK